MVIEEGYTYKIGSIMNKFYITAAIPYVNAKPHVGHALEFVQTDTIARYKKLLGFETLTLSGGDENSIKNVQAAEKTGKNVQEFINENTTFFEELAKKLNVTFNVFQKGSSPEHHRSSQELWKRCEEDIYKKSYTGLYCVGCELFYEKEELNKNAECYEHPGKPLEEVTEENYFFKLSKYQDKIIQLIESDTLKIIPEERKNEALAFAKQGLKDISISRTNARAKNWGVEVPGDPTQRMYVWFDALNIYQSGVGFALDEKKYAKWWPANTHVIGKGILRFHAIYWPAFLFSAGLKVPQSLFVHGYITVDGQKMSKSLGNVIDPVEMIEKYGVDALRYYFLREIPSIADGDFSERRLVELYNSDLANGLGNLASRIARLCENAKLTGITIDAKKQKELLEKELSNSFNNFKLHEGINVIWNRVAQLDKYISDERPWELATQNDPKLNEVLHYSVEKLIEITYLLEPFLPHTAKEIQTIFSQDEILHLEKSLFPKLSV